jgi:tRNA uridine 5-carboxymethylaminomethyl modification enzyme
VAIHSSQSLEDWGKHKQPPQWLLKHKKVPDTFKMAVKYEGYIKRQEEVIQQFKKLEHRRVPEDFNYQDIKGFSNEVAEKLQKVRPSSIGQASRISGVTPAAISLLLVALERHKKAS